MRIQDVEWRAEEAPIDYQAALETMEGRAAEVAAGTQSELAWLLEHPPVYTAGTSAQADELLDARFPVVRTGRGGRYTYHGPGQRIGYLVLDLSRRGRDVRCYVHGLENWLAAALGRLDLEAYAVPGRVGLWTRTGGVEAKVGAIGVRVRRWVTLHGFSVNLDPDLSHFGGIVPCGLPEYPVTSLAALGLPADAETFDAALAFTFPAFLETLTCGESLACRA